ncbi:MAG TPA: lysophospholipid acyltransferase family protein [Kiritimatiellia bacterium]|nr:lysophospholipid acyltransferase family protein [Kiritimatiellia bacterium]
MSETSYSPLLYRFCQRALHVFLKLYNRLEVYGREHIPRQGGVLLVANHVSFIDPPALGCAADCRIVRYMARDTLFSPPWFGRLLRGVAVVPISRSKGDIRALRTALAVLKGGDCLGFFPEGTRSPDGTMQPAKGGVGFLIAKAGVPVVPAFIDGSYQALARHHRCVRPCKVRVFVGPAIDPAEFERLNEGPDPYTQIGSLVMDRIRALAPTP